MTTGGAGPLVPTFHGFVQNSMDGLVLFEACLSGKLHHVPRRPHDRERSSLIKSGSIFIYEENASGIKRWTDGVAWSPSRILGNFLIYRELEKPFPPGEKKRAMKRKRTSLPGEPYPRRDSEQQEAAETQRPLTPPTPSIAGEQKSGASGSDQDKELERSLIGSLVDSYGFRPDGLVKKTMSISINGISHHMVSYYKLDDVKHHLLPRPMTDQRLANISVRPELYLKQNFRAPVEEGDHFSVDNQTMHMHPQAMYQHMSNGAYGVRPGQYFGGQQQQQPQQQQQYSMYNMPVSGSSMYPGATSTSWPATPTSSGAMAYATHPAYAAHSYQSGYYKQEPQSAASVKSEDQTHSSTPQMNGYSHYSSQYPNMQRDGSQASGMVHSQYSTPVQQQSSFAPMGRPSYSNGMNGAVSNGQSHHMYSNSQSSQVPSQQYHVRSPQQQYPMGSAPSSATAASPHHGVKSPVAGSGEQVMHNGHISYSRQNSYGVPQTPQSAGHSTSDMNGLGISGGSSYAAGYGAAGQAFRPVAEVGGGPSQHYGQ